MRRFRFITQEELTERKKTYQTFYVGMMFFLGKEIDITKSSINYDTFVKYFDSTERRSFSYKDPHINGNTWSFCMSSIVEITEEKENNMEEEVKNMGTRIPKDQWGDVDTVYSILGVEMQKGNKYYLLPNVEGFVLVDLKEHTDTQYSSSLDLENSTKNCSMLLGNKKVFKFNSMQEMIVWATS